MKFSNAVKTALPAAILGCLTLGFAPTASAATGTQSANFTVSATVVTACTISANDLSFGNYVGTEMDQSTTLSVNCTLDGPYTIGLSAGSGKNATTAARSMTGAKNKASLNYALFIDDYNKTNWDNTAATGSNVKTGTGTGSSVSIPVYGVLAAGQALVADTYSDLITATVTY
jgi:spore coat protein U-like protein